MEQIKIYKKMKKTSKILLILSMSAALISCTKEESGTVIGAIAGGVIGSQFGGGSGNVAATGIGVMAGAMIGKSIGKNLDAKDKRLMQLTSQRALERSRTGYISTWVNPDSGNTGTITPTRSFNDYSGRVCREYTQTVNIGGKVERVFGRACRLSDGSWQIQN